jgi:hypothetical protein
MAVQYVLRRELDKMTINEQNALQQRKEHWEKLFQYIVHFINCKTTNMSIEV